MASFQSIRAKLPKEFSYWMLPLMSGISWLATLLSLMIFYYTSGAPHYPSMPDRQTIPYISDVGAFTLKPLFITGCVLTTALISLTLSVERFLRHRGRLAANQTSKEKLLAGTSIGFAIVGTLGLVLLSIFDTWRHSTLHNIFLCLFLGGFVVSSVCSCWEYQLLGMHFREFRKLRTSFWLKLVFIILEVILAIAFGVTSVVKRNNAAAILEWTLAFVFSFYVFSFIPDLHPAVYTKSTITNRTAHMAKDWRRPASIDVDHDEDLEKQQQEVINNGTKKHSWKKLMGIGKLATPKPVVFRP